MNTEKENRDLELLQLNVKILNIKKSFNEQLSHIETKIQRLMNKPKPTEAETKSGYEGVGKWYVTIANHIIYAVSYGIRVESTFNKETYWCNDFALQYGNIKRLATLEEIKAAILKGCEQKGIVKGANVKSLPIEGGEPSTDIISNLDLTYFHEDNTAWLTCKDFSVKVFDNGKFAEVVKDEKAKDKELLDEAVELLAEIYHGYTPKERIANLINKLKQ
jgi:hypothetical protein